ncbi:ATP-binding cassette domain-containing protein [Suttonella sp. R2A3]|uniref:ABC transporter ATP-binding protein n=1 Tax=Suttonella sp. R2A3 TaxID=2908648 RepID=UPI001F1E76DD|nr:ATP-binding cassette domain-containing protein [Suttonella sp. R2A3]UJF24377.1 ATP-binding cassette domain-containing protein [Suttonella sp. R2A3]
MKLKVNQLRVQVARQTQPILDIEHLSLAQGEHLAISGASGSGKTTLIHHLCGLARGQAGSVWWDNDDIHRLSPTACDRWRGEHLGLIMQNFYLIDSLSALDNVLLPSALRHFRLESTVRQYALSLLEQLGIKNPRQRTADHSRGEMQRIAIARALLGKPRVLIADEPTASLDAENGAQVAALLHEFSTSCGATFLCVTHDTVLQQHFSHHITLAHGRMIETTLNHEDHT